MSHLAWFSLLGYRIPNEELLYPTEIVVQISYRYFWPLRNSQHIIGKSVDIASKLTSGSYVTVFSCFFPMGPDRLSGPVVTPSISLIMCRNGSSLPCKGPSIHWSGKFTASFNRRIASPSAVNSYRRNLPLLFVLRLFGFPYKFNCTLRDFFTSAW